MNAEQLRRSSWWLTIGPLWLLICRLDSRRQEHIADTGPWRQLLWAAGEAEEVMRRQITQLTGVPSDTARQIIHDLHRSRTAPSPASRPSIAWSVFYLAADGHAFTTDHAHHPLVQHFDGDDVDDPVRDAARALTDETLIAISLARYESPQDHESDAHPGYRHRAVATLHGWTTSQLEQIQRHTTDHHRSAPGVGTSSSRT